jgi:hypothetical protein
MRIDNGFDPSRLIDHFRNLKSKIDAPGLRKDLHRAAEAILSGKEPAKVKDVVRDIHADIEDSVELQSIRDGIKDIRADFRAGVSPDQLQGDLEALKEKLRSFVEENEGSIDSSTIARLRHALHATVRRLRDEDDTTVEPTPIDPGPVAADGDEPVTPAPGSVDFSA